MPSLLPAAMGRVRLSATAPAPWRDSAVLALLALAVYRVLAQRTLHGLDVTDFIDWLQVGKSSHHIHYLYMPLVAALHRVLAPFGWLPHATLLLASQLGGALGVFALHRAGARLGLPRPAAAGVALGAGLAPGVVFFATVGEIHAVFFGAFGLAAWAWASALVRPSGWTAARLGVATAAAAAVHATGHLLVGLLPLMALALCGRAAWQWRVVLAFLGAHAAVAIAADRLLRPLDVDVADAGMVGFLAKSLRQLQIGPTLWPVFRDEWLWALWPGSLLMFAALWAASVRRFAGALLVAWLGYFALTVVLLPNQLVEYGAYLLPFAWPLGLLVVMWWPPLPGWLALAVAATTAVMRVQRHDAQPYENPPLLRGVAELASGGKLFVLCGGDDEWHPLLRDQATVPSAPVFWLGQMLPLGYAGFAARFDALVAAQLDAGYAVVLTAAAYGLITSVPEPTLARFAREHLAVRYATTPIASVIPGFVAYRLTRR